MTEDRIERETLIEASVERVWSLVAEPGFWAADAGRESTRMRGTRMQTRMIATRVPCCSHWAPE